jgi:hypothetical protein
MERKMRGDVLFTTAVVCIVVFVVASYTFTSDDYNGAEYSWNGEDHSFVAGFTDREVIVFSDESYLEEAEGILESSTSNVDSFVLKAPSENTIAFIDETWITHTSGNEPSSDTVENMIENNVPVIFVNGDSYLYKDSGIDLRARTNVEGSLAYGIYYGPSGCVYSYSCSGTDTSEAMLRAYAWADQISKEDQTYEAESNYLHTLPGQYCLKALVVQSVNLFDEGELDANTAYYKVVNLDNPYEYYIIEHGQSAIPRYGTDYKVADIYLNDTLSDSQELFGSEPTTTQGLDKFHISFGFGQGANWSYCLNDVSVVNNSRLDDGVINIWHDVDEKESAGNGYTACPGVLIRVPTAIDGGALNIDDDYGVQFGERISGNYWDMHSHHISVEAYIPN